MHNLALAALHDGRLRSAAGWIQRGLEVDRQDEGIRRLRARLIFRASGRFAIVTLARLVSTFRRRGSDSPQQDSPDAQAVNLRLTGAGLTARAHDSRSPSPASITNECACESDRGAGVRQQGHEPGTLDGLGHLALLAGTGAEPLA